VAPTPCVTASLRLDDDGSAATAALIAREPELAAPLHPDFPYTRADAVIGYEREMARTAGDIVARRTRIAFLDGVAAQRVAAAISSAGGGGKIDAEWVVRRDGRE
jgi:glycerol-3-phosphate dehydrogenase